MVKRSYRTDEIVVHWNSELCIHTAICLNTLPGVFDVQARPWVTADAAGADEIAYAIERCPTGALTYERTDGAPGEEAPAETTIIPWPNGPLMVRGNVEIRDAKGKLFTAGPRFTLCRCGASKNQPFCDLSHRMIGFLNNPRVVSADRDTAESPQDIDPEIGP
jgi:uncharacterized Fe-S cluster protein YjdI/CDGSH-type Zn-finger protein